jgi:hypothetical protein
MRTHRIPATWFAISNAKAHTGRTNGSRPGCACVPLPKRNCQGQEIGGGGLLIQGLSKIQYLSTRYSPWSGAEWGVVKSFAVVGS